MRKVRDLRSYALVEPGDIDVGVVPGGDCHAGSGPAQQRPHVAVTAPEGEGQYNATQRSDGEVDDHRAPRVRQLAGDDRSRPDPPLAQAVREPQRGIVQLAAAVHSRAVEHRGPIRICPDQIRE